MDRLRQILNPNIGTARQIRRRARHFQDAVESPCRKLQPFHRRFGNELGNRLNGNLLPYYPYHLLRPCAIRRRQFIPQ